jgi:alpha-N-arabinofuranosidase
MLQEDALRGDVRAKYDGSLQNLFGTDVDWTGNFLAHCWGNFDGIAEHWYAQPGRRFDVGKAKMLAPEASNDEAYVKVDQTLLESARYGANVVLKKAEEWEGYEQRFPAMRDNKIFLSIDEYAYFGGGFNRSSNLKAGLAYGMILNEMLRHTAFLKMAAHTTGISMLDLNRTASTFSTTGLVFKLFSDHFVGSIPVYVDGDSPQPDPKFPGVADQPDKNSGSPTYPLDMVAALSPDHKYLILSVVNATETPQNFNLNLAGVRPNGEASEWQLTGSSVDAANRVGKPPEVAITERSIQPNTHNLSVAPISVNVYQFPISEAH